jgi:hypothetical protein
MVGSPFGDLWLGESGGRLRVSKMSLVNGVGQPGLTPYGHYTEWCRWQAPKEECTTLGIWCSRTPVRNLPPSWARTERRGDGGLPRGKKTVREDKRTGGGCALEAGPGLPSGNSEVNAEPSQGQGHGSQARPAAGGQRQAKSRGKGVV